MNNLIILVIIFFVVVQTPFAIASMILFLNSFRIRKNNKNKINKDRKLIAVIVTIGNASETVNKIIKQLKSYDFPMMDILVLIEEHDKSKYDAKTMSVPKDYKTKNNSLAKHRALNYFSEQLPYSENLYVIHLDDDSIVSKEYITNVLKMNEVAGQGSLAIREYKHNLINTLSDFKRKADCDVWCANANYYGRPLGVHGEGLVIRADIEKQIGWDFKEGKFCAEDYIMGQLISLKHKFAYIHGGIFIAPPLTYSDFYKQRRRWAFNFLKSLKIELKANFLSTVYFIWQYSTGWLISLGFIAWIYILITKINIPTILIWLTSFNLLVTFIMYLYGSLQVKNLKYSILMILLTIPIELYQSPIFFYRILCPPKEFIVIKKV